MSTRVSAPTLHDIWAMNLQLTAVQARPSYLLKLTYGDGAEYELDLSALVGTGGQSDQLVDEAYFAQVRLGDNGDWIEWPNGFDIGADTLRWDGELARRGLTRSDVSDSTG